MVKVCLISSRSALKALPLWHKQVERREMISVSSSLHLQLGLQNLSVLLGWAAQHRFRVAGGAHNSGKESKALDQ